MNFIFIVLDADFAVTFLNLMILSEQVTHSKLPTLMVSKGTQTG